MRTLVISDIHGCLNEFLELLDLVDYQAGKDRLILLGDYVDRGPKSKEVVQKVMDLAKNDNVVVLRGNHDQRFVTLVENRNPEMQKIFIKYGGLETLKSYCPFLEDNDLVGAFEFIRKAYSHHIDFLKKTKLYYEDNHYIYVHAGLNPNYENWKNQPERDFYTIRGEFINHKTNTEKKVVFGHTVTVFIHGSADIWFSEDKIGIDGGCAYGYQLNCLEIGTDHKLKQYHVPCRSIS
ncbi:metallophosphoesterase family protein [Caldibacillus debilis]|uniref:metallophosphoesterase family protein n=1 Tax=Caldibacillus debilis TaxID=301148 RepID=UPI0007792543|nr:metallophosphoesterase family protein [Caldibacillus debilis]